MTILYKRKEKKEAENTNSKFKQDKVARISEAKMANKKEKYNAISNINTSLFQNSRKY